MITLIALTITGILALILPIPFTFIIWAVLIAPLILLFSFCNDPIVFVKRAVVFTVVSVGLLLAFAYSGNAQAATCIKDKTLVCDNPYHIREYADLMKKGAYKDAENLYKEKWSYWGGKPRYICIVTREERPIKVHKTSYITGVKEVILKGYTVYVSKKRITTCKGKIKMK